MPAIPPIPRKYPAALGEMTMKNTESLAACGSPNCGGCYEVGGGFKIHPPKPNQAQGVCGRPDCVGCFTVEDVTFHQKSTSGFPMVSSPCVGVAKTEIAAACVSSVAGSVTSTA